MERHSNSNLFNKDELLRHSNLRAGIALIESDQMCNSCVNVRSLGDKRDHNENKLIIGIRRKQNKFIR